MVAGGVFVVASGQAAEMLQSRKGAFDAVPLPIQGLAELPLHPAIALRGNDRFGAMGFDVLHDRIGVVPFVGNHRLGSALAQQSAGLRRVMHLSGR